MKIDKKMQGLAASLALCLTAGVFPVGAGADVPRTTQHYTNELCERGKCIWEKVIQCDGFIEGINFDNRGQLWMVSVVAGKILRAENGKCLTVKENFGIPNGAKFAPDGRLFIANRTKGIQVFDPKTGLLTNQFSGTKSSQFKGLNDLVFDAKGGYYFTDPVGSDALNKSGHVYYVSPGQGSEPVVFADGIAYPNGITLSPDGQNLYVAEFGENRILMIPSRDSKDPFGISYVFARLKGGIGPDGLTTDSAGNVYAAHYGAGEIAVFDRQGFPYGTIPLPQDAGLGSTNMAFKDGYLYVTESLKNEVWRVRLNHAQPGIQP